MQDNLWTRNPRLETLLQAGIIILVGFCTVFGIIFEKSIQDATEGIFTYNFWLFIGCSVLIIFIQLVLLLTTPPKILLENFKELLLEAKNGVYLLPTLGWESWTFKDWEAHFSKLCRLIERLVVAVHADHSGIEREVFCNLMVVFQGSLSDEQLKSIYDLVAHGQEPCNPYSGNIDGILRINETRYTAVMVAKKSDAVYRYIHLRVHYDKTKAMIGAPTAIHAFENAIENQENNINEKLFYHDIPDTHNIKPQSYARNLSNDARNAVSGYFTANSSVKSFISLALHWRGQIVGVLNIDSTRINIFNPPKIQHVLIGILSIYTYVASVYAHIFLEKYEEWNEVPRQTL